ncbi:MAG: putative toxin-antitoxin system toxin component, PIN family [Myxococcaceae bacterium]
MRVVVDTSVIAAALTTPNPHSASPVVLAAAAAGAIQLVITDELEAEYRRAVNYPEVVRYAAKVDRLVFVSVIVAAAERVTAIPSRGSVPSDPGDDMVVAAALGGNAEFVVTLDKDLLRLRTVGGIRLLKPGDFLRELP